MSRLWLCPGGKGNLWLIIIVKVVRLITCTAELEVASLKFDFYEYKKQFRFSKHLFRKLERKLSTDILLLLHERKIPAKNSIHND
jgi:hypothetical protein